MSSVPALLFLAVIALIAVAYRAACSRNRTPVGWGALSMAAAAAAMVGGSSVLESGLESESSAYAAICEVLIGALIAQLIVVLILRGLPRGQGHFGLHLTVAQRGTGGEAGQASETGRVWIDQDGLHLMTSHGKRVFARTELADIEAAGEFVTLHLRSDGEEICFQVTEFPDLSRRCRASAQLAAALRPPIAHARLRSG
jgi:hypothetical protein